ncbi:MAG: 30S ribosomal protein THX [Bacteroidetes bacterium]|nr:30S ribosomal protein THX [Bacteroidota bacterium]
MGKGDKKTKRGKILMGTSGRLRPRKRNKRSKQKTTKKK